MTGEAHCFGSDLLSACVKADGAELCRLRDAAGTEYLWDAGPAWPRHAPVLFPIVGRLKDDTLRHRGVSYRLTQHGFARDRRFAWVERTPEGCRLVLEDDEATRARYPFRFRFELAFRVAATALSVDYGVTNTGEEVLPASMGAHPAFRWPLQPRRMKTDYALTFESEETEKLRGVEDGLLTPADRLSPIRGRFLPLSVALFAADALILSRPASRSVRFAAADGPALTVAWEGFPHLGLWMRPGGDFLCIEPWAGMASPPDFDGDILEKPWMMLIPPGESRRAGYTVTVEPG
ncbi:aldose 1-epimerase family protein [Rhodopila sp.]|uniref:aldose 1-epimerase family protein n=1 Tax=Rhodopila sp. TaxID=2480087 RepID=UPI002B88E3F2|nr:aldose 1-epimerase family protein [Rhodopila sp.]HVZ07034.1 aldose 1-epimerase family protein [Rhodopila sp.]